MCTRSVVSKYVNETLAEQKRNGVQMGDNENSILNKLLRKNPHYAKLMAFDMLFAGVDSTSSTMAHLLHQLAINQDQQAKLIDEVFGVLPDADLPLTAESLDGAPYYRACLKEALRVQPIIPAQLRATGQDLVLEGYQIPKMVCFTLKSFVLHCE